MSLQVVYHDRPAVSGLTSDGNTLYWSERLVPNWKGSSVKKGCLDAKCRVVQLDTVSAEVCATELTIASPAFSGSRPTPPSTSVRKDKPPVTASVQGLVPSQVGAASTRTATSASAQTSDGTAAKSSNNDYSESVRQK